MRQNAFYGLKNNVKSNVCLFMENKVNQVTAFMLYIYNRWNIQEARDLFGNNLGEHIFSKYLHNRKVLGELFWYSELDTDCRRKIVERAVEIYGKESLNK